MLIDRNFYYMISNSLQKYLARIMPELFFHVKVLYI